MEVIRKPQQPATEIISIRVTEGLKKEYAKARDIAQRQDIDMTAMVTNALSEVFKTIIHAGTRGAASPSASGADGRKRLQNVDEAETPETYSNGGTK